jgi:hypothetical protein
LWALEPKPAGCPHSRLLGVAHQIAEGRQEEGFDVSLSSAFAQQEPGGGELTLGGGENGQAIELEPPGGVADGAGRIVVRRGLGDEIEAP